MTTTTTTGYAEAVRRALEDLPPATVAELIEGLDEHLAEVDVADLVSLFALLGPPERYAADLRASAGLPPRAVSTPSTTLPPPVPPPARAAFDIRGRHLARVALVIGVVGALLSLAAAHDFVEPMVVLVITAAVGAGALVLRWLSRVAEIPARWATGSLVFLAALALAVAATAGAAHPRNDGTPYPYSTTVAVTAPFARSTMPDLTGVDVQNAIDALQQMGVAFSIVGPGDPSSVVVSQDPPPGSYLQPGFEVRLVTGSAGATPTTFPATAPTTTIQPAASGTTTFRTVASPPSETPTSAP